jgi:hypothetical protein
VWPPDQPTGQNFASWDKNDSNYASCGEKQSKFCLQRWNIDNLLPSAVKNDLICYKNVAEGALWKKCIKAPGAFSRLCLTLSLNQDLRRKQDE